MLLSAPMACPQSEGAGEYRLKAEFLLNLTKFVDWPEDSFPDAHAPFVICVLGQDPFGASLDDMTEGRVVGERAVEVDRYPAIRNLSEARFCQIAFASSSEKQHFRKIIGFFKGKSVLLVGDSADFASSGGAVEFQMEDKEVHVAVNPDAVARARLSVSSKLMMLAKIIHDDPANGKS